MVDQYSNAVRGVLDSAISQLQTSFARREFQYIRDYFFTAKEVSTEQLGFEVERFYSDQPWYSKLALKVGIKKIPPRVRAFEQELSERLADCKN